VNRAGSEILRVEMSSLRRRYEELASLLKVLHRLSGLDRTLISSSDFSERLARILVEETRFTLCAVFGAERDAGVPRLLSSFGFRSRPENMDGPEDLLLEPGTALYEFARRVVQLNRVQFMEEVSLAGSLQGPGDGLGSRLWSLVGFPLADWGGAVLVDAEGGSFSGDQRRHWEIFAGLVTGILTDQNTIHQLEMEREELGKALEERERVLRRETGASLAAENLMGTIMALVPQGVCFLADDGRILRVNQRMARLLDVRSAELLGQSPEILFSRPTDFEALKSRADRDGSARLSDLDMGGGGMAGFSADVFLANISQLRHPSVRYILIVEDISEKKAFSRQLVRTEKLAALGTMAGGVAHDFNNILMSILGNTQLLAQEITAGGRGAERRLQSIEQAVGDGAHIVRRLQKFTEKESDRGRGEQKTDLRCAVIDVIELTRPRWKNTVERAGHTVEIRMDLEDGILGAIHPADLREVLTNLVFNAVDAMPQGGRLSFKAYRQADRAVLEVSDTGVGMDAETRDRIFDPFFSTKGVGNSGLGLSVCRSLILRTGGEMLVASEPGRGTTFTIKLPAADEEGPGCDRGLGLRLKTTGKSLLVVDDEKEILELLRDMLRLMGHRVTATHDPRRALSYLETAAFDLVLTDLGMPEVSGWDVAKAAKASKDSLPVILVTGWGAQYEGHDLSDKGVDLVLSKPLSYQKLLESLSLFA